MPKIKRTRRRYKKKQYNKYKRFRKLSSPIPYKFVTKLRYVDTIRVDAIAAGVAIHNFRANDCYDPDSSGGGHQPRGFDQIMALFNKFVVLGSKITCKFGAVTDTATDCMVAVRTRTSSDTPSTYIDVLEDRKVRSKLLCPGNNEGLTITNTYSHKKWHRNSPFSGTEYAGSSISAPEEQVFYQIMSAAINADNPVAIDCVVTLDLIVAFYDPINPSMS